MPKKMKQEIFAVGTWNGMPFTLADLKSMANTFHTLKENIKVPLKLGHNDEQPLTDGQPALGWVTDVFVDVTSKPEKLVAEFSDVPDVLFEAMSKKLYTSVSIELDFDVQYKGRDYPMVLSAVAILGADVPAVNVLNQLTEYMSKAPKCPSALFTGQRHAVFTAINFNSNLGADMPTVEELQAQLKVANAEKEAAEKEAKENEAKFNKLSDEQKQKDAEAKKAAIDSTRKEAKELFEKAVTDKKITPAKRDALFKVIKIDDDEAVAAMNMDDVKALLDDESKGSGAQFSKQSIDDNPGSDSDQLPEGETIDGYLVKLTRKHMAKNNIKSFSVAQEQIYDLYPDLARQYFDANGIKVEREEAEVA